MHTTRNRMVWVYATDARVSGPAVQADRQARSDRIDENEVPLRERRNFHAIENDKIVIRGSMGFLVPGFRRGEVQGRQKTRQVHLERISGPDIEGSEWRCLVETQESLIIRSEVVI